MVLKVSKPFFITFNIILRFKLILILLILFCSKSKYSCILYHRWRIRNSIFGLRSVVFDDDLDYQEIRDNLRAGNIDINI